MRMYDILTKKKLGQELSKEEIFFFVDGFTKGEIPDYQASALTMAICIQGMNDRETADLTMAMACSGDMADTSSLPETTADKHSTGGVGDKTSLIVIPLAAALGVTMAKMSGRGLGHTGGTVDKLESIPGFQTALAPRAFLDVVQKTGAAMVGQSGNFAPADKKLYALRDVTATVESIPLIASSIMSKKLAAGANHILLDVKVGSGAFMETREEALKLAQTMVEIGERSGKKTLALLTGMEQPLGFAIGNALEVQEAIETLQGKGPRDLTELSLRLAAEIAGMTLGGDWQNWYKKGEEALQNGTAFLKFAEIVQAQGGDTDVLYHPEKFPGAAAKMEVLSPETGYLSAMDTKLCGIACVELGAGRQRKEDTIDLSAGILLRKKTGDFVSRGECLGEVYAANTQLCKKGAEILVSALSFQETPVLPPPLFLDRVSQNGTEPLDL